MRVRTRVFSSPSTARPRHLDGRTHALSESAARVKSGRRSSEGGRANSAPRGGVRFRTSHLLGAGLDPLAAGMHLLGGGSGPPS